MAISFPSLLVVGPLEMLSPQPLLSESSSSCIEPLVVLVVQKLLHGH